jgi:hypothetical protein
MADPVKATSLWVEALSSPDHDTEALGPVLADDVTTVSALGTTEGKEAVLATFGQSPIAALFTQARWSEPTADGNAATVACTFPSGAPVAGVTITATVDDAGLIKRVETGVVQAPPPEAQPVRLTDAMREAVNGALGDRTPVTVAYVDADGQPHLSLRGTAQVFSDGQLALWIRNPGGGLLAAIGTNPHLALFYRNPQSRTTYQFHGRARRDDSDDVRTVVFDNSPEQERNFDPQRRGAAVIIDVDRVEGRDANGPVLMART